MKVQYRLLLLKQQSAGSKKELELPPNLLRTFEMEVSSMEEAEEYIKKAMELYKQIHGRLVPEGVEFNCIIEDTEHPMRN